MIADSSGYMHKAKVGDYIGTNAGRIVEITANKVTIIEQLKNSTGEVKELEKSLKLTN